MLLHTNFAGKLALQKNVAKVILKSSGYLLTVTKELLVFFGRPVQTLEVLTKAHYPQLFLQTKTNVTAKSSLLNVALCQQLQQNESNIPNIFQTMHDPTHLGFCPVIFYALFNTVKIQRTVDFLLIYLLFSSSFLMNATL